MKTTPEHIKIFAEALNDIRMDSIDADGGNRAALKGKSIEAWRDFEKAKHKYPEYAKEAQDHYDRLVLLRK